MKIYIHHYYSDSIFYKFAHNTKNRIFDIKNNEGSVFCDYNGIEMEFIFKPEISDEKDGYHLLDFFATHEQREFDSKFKNIQKSVGIDGRIEVMNCLYSLIEDKKNWLITIFSTEKIFVKNEDLYQYKKMDLLIELENVLLKFNNHRLITDQIFLNKKIENNYKNHFYAFTNSIWEWNNMSEIRWYYEFKRIYDKLTFTHDLCYSIRNHKYYRIVLINELRKLDNNKIFLQRTDYLKNEDYIKYEKDVLDIPLNSVVGEFDFDILELVNFHQCIGLDLFFRMLPMGKMHILDESWAWVGGDFSSQYLSEKSIGFILAGIPFISTHTYPIEIIQKIVNTEEYPFFDEVKNAKGNPKTFAKFIENFMNNFEDNFLLCKKWTDECHRLFMEKFNTENSLLDLIIDEFKKPNVKENLF